MTNAILKWLAGDDTGSSSKAIALTALGRMPDHPSHPHDNGDFGRCSRLLAAAPEAGKALVQLGTDGGPYWRALVQRWADIEAAYQADGTNREFRGDQRYRLMRSILDPIEKTDPNVVRFKGGALYFGRGS